MVIRYADILSLLTALSDEQGLQVTVTESAKGGVIAGLSCALGGVLLGPPGLALGGAVGGCVAAYVARGQFRSVSSIILEEMSEERKQQLVDAVQGIVRNVEAADAVELIAIVQGNALLHTQVAQEIVTFFNSQMNMPVSHAAAAAALGTR